MPSSYLFPQRERVTHVAAAANWSRRQEFTQVPGRWLLIDGMEGTAVISDNARFMVPIARGGPGTVALGVRRHHPQLRQSASMAHRCRRVR
jgi:hypothetical protein